MQSVSSLALFGEDAVDVWEREGKLAPVLTWHDVPVSGKEPACGDIRY